MLKKILLNENGEVSLSKIGTALVSLSAIVLMIPTLNLDVITLPAIVTDLAKIAAAIGGGTAAIGFRDAIGRARK